MASVTTNLPSRTFHIERMSLDGNVTPVGDFTDDDNIQMYGGITVRAEPIPFPGDLNGDGFVGHSDLGIVLDWWGHTVTPGVQADPTGDGFVGQFDLDIVLDNWGEGTLPTSPVPEPMTAALLALAGLALLRPRCR